MGDQPDVYEHLAAFLDRLPGGFPRSDSGVELRILKSLFTPEEAELAMHLTLIREEARVVARRAKRPLAEVAEMLEEMTLKGLISSSHPKDGRPPTYSASQYVVGIYEFQVNRLNKEFVEANEEYLPILFKPEIWQKAPQLRTIPVGESIPIVADVMPYEQAECLIEQQDTFAVLPCICRKEKQLLGEGCDKPLETCLSFGSAADFAVHAGRGRYISRQETLDILALANEQGLVLQPANARKANFICCCCGDCCGVLRSIKRYPAPAELVSSPYYAEVDEELCNICGICETRCQMEAISLDDGWAMVDRRRCIGCGLCVSSCTTEAISLVRKPEEEQTSVPRNVVETYIRLARARGVMETRDLVKLQVKSKVDRLLAS